MKLTVVMSALNSQRHEHLPESIESVLKQSYPDFKFIIYNNGSTDGTGEILDHYARQDERIQVIHNTTTVRLPEARNRLMAMAETDWVALMNDDDVSEPHRFERQMAAIEQFGDRLGAVGSWAHHISSQGKILGRRILEPTTLEKFNQMFADNAVINLMDPAPIVHRPTFLAVGGYRAETTMAFDLDLWHRIPECGKSLLILPEYLLRYRVHRGSESVQKGLMHRRETHFVNYNMLRRRRGLEELPWNDFLEQIWASPWYRYPKLRTDLSMTFYKQAGLYYGENKRISAAANLIAAGIIKPEFVFKRMMSQKGPRLLKKRYLPGN